MTGTPPPRPRVLVVDDDPLMVDLLTAALAAMGHTQVTTAANGLEALARVGRDTDVVILDLNMPEMDGLSLMGALSEAGFDGGLILITGESGQVLRSGRDLARAHGLLVLGVLPKPVDADRLGRAVGQFSRSVASADGTAAPPAPTAEQGPGLVIDEDTLRLAIEAGQITVHYQPKVRWSDRKVVGLEALARWIHPIHGMIEPGRFIPLAELTGLIAPLTGAVVGRVLGDWAHVLRDKVGSVSVSINLSPLSLTDRELPDRLSGLLEQAGIEPHRLLLEITESRSIDDPKSALEVIARLRMRGFRFSIDDFGTGYAGMQHLRMLPLSELKVDRALVQAAVDDESARAILQTAVALARRLGLTVVAEGVETAEQWELMGELGLSLVQGYYVARPMATADAQEWIAAAGDDPADVQ